MLLVWGVAHAGTFRGQLIREKGNDYAIEVPTRITFVYRVRWAKSVNQDLICRANQKARCPRYTLSFASVRKISAETELLDARIIKID